MSRMGGDAGEDIGGTADVAERGTIFPLMTDSVEEVG
jgi:hypothetical protein